MAAPVLVLEVVDTLLYINLKKTLTLQVRSSK